MALFTHSMQPYQFRAAVVVELLEIVPRVLAHCVRLAAPAVRVKLPNSLHPLFPCLASFLSPSVA